MKDPLSAARDELAKQLAHVDKQLRQRREAAEHRRELNTRIGNLEDTRRVQAAKLEATERELADLRLRRAELAP